MVSRVPTFSLKRFRVPREWVLPTLLAIGVAAAFLTTEPWATLLVVGARLSRLDPGQRPALSAAAPRRRGAAQIRAARVRLSPPAPRQPAERG